MSPPLPPILYKLGLVVRIQFKIYGIRLRRRRDIFFVGKKNRRIGKTKKKTQFAFGSLKLCSYTLPVRKTRLHPLALFFPGQSFFFFIGPTFRTRACRSHSASVLDRDYHPDRYFAAAAVVVVNGQRRQCPRCVRHTRKD